MNPIAFHPKCSVCTQKLSGLINTFMWVLATYEVEDAQGLSTGDQLINLRQQLEAQARVDRLYAKRSKNWISWSDVQLTRLRATKAYAAIPPTANRDTKRRALIDLLTVLFHSITPPDRVVRWRPLLAPRHARRWLIPPFLLAGCHPAVEVPSNAGEGGRWMVHRPHKVSAQNEPILWGMPSFIVFFHLPNHTGSHPRCCFVLHSQQRPASRR